MSSRRRAKADKTPPVEQENPLAAMAEETDGGDNDTVATPTKPSSTSPSSTTDAPPSTPTSSAPTPTPAPAKSSSSSSSSSSKSKSKSSEKSKRSSSSRSSSSKTTSADAPPEKSASTTTASGTSKSKSTGAAAASATTASKMDVEPALIKKTTAATKSTDITPPPSLRVTISKPTIATPTVVTSSSVASSADMNAPFSRVYFVDDHASEISTQAGSVVVALSEVDARKTLDARLKSHKLLPSSEHPYTLTELSITKSTAAIGIAGLSTDATASTEKDKKKRGKSRSSRSRSNSSPTSPTDDKLRRLWLIYDHAPLAEYPPGAFVLAVDTQEAFRLVDHQLASYGLPTSHRHPYKLLEKDLSRAPAVERLRKKELSPAQVDYMQRVRLSTKSMQPPGSEAFLLTHKRPSRKYRNGFSSSLSSNGARKLKKPSRRHLGGSTSLANVKFAREAQNAKRELAKRRLMSARRARIAASNPRKFVIGDRVAGAQIPHRKLAPEDPF